MGTRIAAVITDNNTPPPNWFPCGAWEPEITAVITDNTPAAQLVPMRRMG
ncbi:MAG: hypothetical protein GY862_29870, partial [Gammaproteobacteria bacterium]|nr:hypothetical protein [Gammaproteobacteria bacterium]